MSDVLATAPAVTQAAALARGDISSRELLELFLDRIARIDGDVNAVVTLDADRARGRAARADDARARGEELGPLHGLPVTIKDAIETAGIRTTGGAVELMDHVPTHDAPAVARLRRAGAIVFGKTNLPRWSGDLQSFNEMFGTTNNPWDTSRTAGGSSGGPAAAVACGFTSFEIGTDLAGSVRMPSHWCGVYGLKPSFGLVPQRGYLDHLGGGVIDVDLNVFGPIARSADDLDLLLDVLAGPEPERAPAWRATPPPPAITDLRECRVGLWLDDQACPIGHEYSRMLRAAVDQLADAGARIDDSHPPVGFDEQLDLFVRLLRPAASPTVPPERAEAMAGSHLAWLRAQEERARVGAVWAEWFTDHDVLLCPVNLGAAIPHDHEGAVTERTFELDGAVRAHAEQSSWPGLVGVIGLPSCVPPIGRTASGLPVGVQVVAPFLADRTAIRVARLVAEASGAGYEPPPVVRAEPA